MQVRDIMRTRVVTIGPRESASAAWTRMRRRNIRHLVVTDDSRIVGVLSERDLGGRAGASVRKNRRVRDLMTPQVVSAQPDTTLEEAADLVRSRLIGSLPVLEGDRLAGIVTATDVFETLGRETLRLSRAERELLRSPRSSRALGGQPVVRGRSEQHRPKRQARRASQSDKREPFADRVPRPEKRAAGRTPAPLVPANIRVEGVTLSEHGRDMIRKKLGAKLGKFAPSIERVTVRVEDVNGPKGGVDQECRIKVVLSGLPSVSVKAQAATLPLALSGALGSAERAVRRVVQRRRTKPLRTATTTRSERIGSRRQFAEGNAGLVL